MRAAEDHALSYLLKNWTEDEVSVVGRNDFTFRVHVAYVALELASEGRPGFTSADGKGRYWAQYERAGQHFDRMAKNRAHTTASSKGAGKGAQSGGEIRPAAVVGQPHFTFVPDKGSPTRGGF